MAKITRKTAKTFGKNATNLGQIGSALASAPISSDDPDVLQALSAMEAGIDEVIVPISTPTGTKELITKEEMQALFYLCTRQAAYVLQEGIPEYDPNTPYYEYSVVKKPGTYELYGSKIDNNEGNALPSQTDDVNWQYLGTLSDNINVLIKDYSIVGNVGDAGQQFAGRDYTLAELQAEFGAKLVSFYPFASANLGEDLTGNYTYTLGAGAKEPSAGVGIMGVAGTAISFDGGDYATHATKFDDFNTMFSGVGKGFIHSFWLSAPNDGQPAAQAKIFHKYNTAINDRYVVILNTNGSISVSIRGNSATTTTLTSKTRLPNGANTVHLHIVVSWSTYSGLGIYVNKVLEGQDTGKTTLMANGNTSDFYFGAEDNTPTSPLTARVMNEVIVNDVCTQDIVDFLYAKSVPLPTVLQGKNFDLICKYKHKGNDNNIKTTDIDILQVRSSDILLDGNIGRFNSSDKVALFGRV